MTRINRVSLVVLAALVCVFAFSATAFAATGDSAPNATDLRPYVGSSLTTDLAGGSAAGSNTSYYFKIELNKGQTLNADMVPGSHVVNFKAFVMYGDAASGGFVNSSLYRLKYTAPTHTMFTVYIATSGRDDTETAPGSFTISPTLLSPVTVGTPSASGSPSHKKTTTIKGKVTPGHTTPVTLTIERKVGSKWKPYLTKKLTSSSGGNWSYKKKFPARTYRMRAATPVIAGKYNSGTSAWRTVKVK